VIRVVLAVALVCALSACGATTKKTITSPPETQACRVMTSAVVDDVRELLRDYEGNPSPADLPFYDLREDLTNIQARCRLEWLGEDLDGAFSQARLAKLYALLPATYVSYLRTAVGCARADTPRPACEARPRTISSPGATGTGSTPHPVKP
jgi:hypothetical protein